MTRVMRASAADPRNTVPCLRGLKMEDRGHSRFPRTTQYIPDPPSRCNPGGITMPVRRTCPAVECWRLQRWPQLLLAALVISGAPSLSIPAMAQDAPAADVELYDQFVYDLRGRPLPATMVPFWPQA